MDAEVRPPGVVGVVADSGGADRAGRSVEIDRRVAYHEARHAIIARIFDRKLGGATIVATDRYSGLVWGEGSTLALAGEIDDESERILDELRKCDGGEVLISVISRLVELSAGSICEALVFGDVLL